MKGLALSIPSSRPSSRTEVWRHQRLYDYITTLEMSFAERQRFNAALNDNLTERLLSIENRTSAPITGNAPPAPATDTARHRRTKAQRAKLSQAATARWAKRRAEEAGTAAPPAVETGGQPVPVAAKTRARRKPVEKAMSAGGGN
jgi:hypothetical protein